jgi:formylglycine-generating enzyme required for sulfatase activity
MAMGTLHYMAPEALMLGSAVDHRADIYAVGVMLYQMLTGKVPHGMFELPSLQVPGLDPRYDEIIAKAMREDRERRFQQITELRRDLDGILTQPVVKVEADASHAPAALPTQARPPRPAGQPYRPPQRPVTAPPPKQSSSGMFMWVTLAAVLVAGGAWWLNRTPTAAPQPVVAQDTPAPAKPAATVPKAAPPATSTPTPAPSLPPELAALNTQFIALQQESVIAPFAADLAKLNSSYLGGIARKITEEQAAGHAADVLALEAEQKRITANQPVPETDAAATPASLKALRSIYRDALAKIIASRAVNLQALTDPLDKRLVQMAADFTQSKRLTDAQTVRSYREVLALKDGYTNTLGMKFVPVPGTKALFCIHETRYQDYAAYAAESPGVDKTWQNQNHDGFVITERAPEHPVTMVDWEDSSKFCLWLSKKEGKAYRLPTDREWSCAAGLGDYEKWGYETTPATVNKHRSDFPWGGAWPPPPSVGNYSDQSRRDKTPVANAEYMEGFNDGFPTTAPVMSFPPNKLGLYDLGGNLWEWCEDWNDGTEKQKVVRGGSWSSFREFVLTTSYRLPQWPTKRSEAFGFRVVLELP